MVFGTGIALLIRLEAVEQGFQTSRTASDLNIREQITLGSCGSCFYA